MTTATAQPLAIRPDRRRSALASVVNDDSVFKSGSLSDEFSGNQLPEQLDCELVNKLHSILPDVGRNS
jgi:hypothetical protein